MSDKTFFSDENGEPRAQGVAVFVAIMFLGFTAFAFSIPLLGQAFKAWDRQCTSFFGNDKPHAEATK